MIPSACHDMPTRKVTSQFPARPADPAESADPAELHPKDHSHLTTRIHKDNSVEKPHSIFSLGTMFKNKVPTIFQTFTMKCSCKCLPEFLWNLFSTEKNSWCGVLNAFSIAIQNKRRLSLSPMNQNVLQNLISRLKCKPTLTVRTISEIVTQQIAMPTRRMLKFTAYESPLSVTWAALWQLLMLL